MVTESGDASQPHVDLSHLTAEVGKWAEGNFGNQLDILELITERHRTGEYVDGGDIGALFCTLGVNEEAGELAIHKLDQQGADVPFTSELFCSIIALAGMNPGYIDVDTVTYIGVPTESKAAWPRICRDDLEYSAEHHNCIHQCNEWLGIGS